MSMICGDNSINLRNFFSIFCFPFSKIHFPFNQTETDSHGVEDGCALRVKEKLGFFYMFCEG